MNGRAASLLPLVGIIAPVPADSRPLWRQVFDKVEGGVAPPLERAVRSEQFADMVGALGRLRSTVERRTERASRRWLHRWNLPAGSDIRRLSEQVASLERRVRELNKRLEETGGQNQDARPVQPKRARRSDPA